MSKRFKIWQVNTTQCGIRDIVKEKNIVFSESRSRLQRVCDALNELDKENQSLNIEIDDLECENERLNDELMDYEDDEDIEERFKIVNNYHKGLVVIDTHISTIERDDFYVNIICENNNLYRLVDLLNSQYHEIKKLKKTIKENE